MAGGSSVNDKPLTQTTTIDSGDNGYATIVIKTFQGAIDKIQAMNDALKMEKINDLNVNEVGTYDTTLANGESVTIHNRVCAAFPSNGGKFDVSAFMPDSTTVVKVTSTMDKYRTKALLGSLKIGEMQAA